MNHAERYAAETITVAVPCPQCGAEKLERTYIPALGSMNGEVHCQKCGFEDTYVASLASAMPSDPLPNDYVVRPVARPLLVVDLELQKPRAIMLPTPVASMASFLGLLFSAIARAVTPARVYLSPRSRRPLARPRNIARRFASVVGRP